MPTSKLSLKQLCRVLISGELALHSYLAETLRLIQEREATLHALLPEESRAERLHREADELLNKYPHPAQRPALFGILVGVKDLYNVDGLPTRAGSRLPESEFAGKEAALVTTLKQAGALILGKTVSTEFAYFSPGETRNPLNPQHTPGGSSSGSAAAVAAGYCPLALGTQTIASVIRPASFCGICGCKPTQDRLPLQGIFPFSQSADQAGYLCRDIADLAFVALLLIPDWNRSAHSPQPLLGAVGGEFLAQADASTRQNYANCLKRLSEAGYRLIDHDPFPDIQAINETHRRLTAAEFARNHQRLYPLYAHLYSAPSRELYATGSAITDAELLSLRAQRADFQAHLDSIMRQTGIKIWLTPSTITTAPLGLASTGSPLMSLPWTHAGLPSLTLPSGFDDLGLPFGLQLISARNEDEFLLESGIQIQDQILT